MRSRGNGHVIVPAETAGAAAAGNRLSKQDHRLIEGTQHTQALPVPAGRGAARKGEESGREERIDTQPWWGEEGICRQSGHMEAAPPL